MPTGYTADLYDGKDVSLPDFILGCARAFGALIEMRDDPKDAPIPDEFTPSTYHRDAIEKAQRRLVELAEMTTEEQERQSEAEHRKAVLAWKERRKESFERRRRYEAMLRQVQCWTPPTPEHSGLREFMVEQLEKSIEFDCSTRYDDAPLALAPGAWWTAQIERAQRDVEYHSKHDAEERERAAGRTEWVRALRESLPVSG